MTTSLPNDVNSLSPSASDVSSCGRLIGDLTVEGVLWYVAPETLTFFPTICGDEGYRVTVFDEPGRAKFYEQVKSTGSKSVKISIVVKGSFVRSEESNTVKLASIELIPSNE